MSSLQNAHRLHVQSLYKRALKTSLDWYIQRDLWRQKALDIRAQFERNKHVSNPKEIQLLLKNAEKELQSWAHPDPYKRTLSFCLLLCIEKYSYLYMCVLYIAYLGPDGTKWERNLPPIMVSLILDEMGCGCYGNNRISYNSSLV